MYAKYIQEVEGSQVIETDFGFAEYSFEEIQDSYASIYVKIVWVHPDHRGKKNAAKLTQMCIDRASKVVEKPIQSVFTSACLVGNDKTSSLKAILGFGFKPFKAENNMIYFHKEIKNV